MTVWRGLLSRVTLSALLLCVIHCDTSIHTTDSPLPALESSQHGDFMQFESVPDTVMEESIIQVKYKCSRACRIGVEVVLSTPKTIGLVSFRRTWTHLRSFGETRVRSVQLTYPPAVLYRRDFFMRQPVEAQHVMVRAWLVHLDGEENNGSHVGMNQYHQSVVRTFKILQTLPVSERPVRPQSRSASWGDELMWNLSKDKIQQCSPESDVVDLLVFPFASTGEKFGVIRTFSTFMNRELETSRRQATEQPRVSLSVWLYLLDWCSQKFCGILRHINQNRKYDTPLLMLTDSGKVVVQVYLVSREEKAFTAHTSLPLLTWIRLDLLIHGPKAKLRISQVNPTGGVTEAAHSYEFPNAVLHNDTSGYFVIGGDMYMPGILGYFGPIKYHRLGTEKVENPLSPLKTLKLLDEAHTECEEMRHITEDFLQALQDGQAKSTNDVCESSYEELRRTFVQPRCVQTWSWDQQVKYSSVLKIFREHEEQLVSGPQSSRRASLVVQQLFQEVVRRLAEAGGDDVGASVTEQLKVCSCLGHHQASLMLATLHLAGLGLPPDQEQGHVYSLMGGLADDRLALLHLGYKHMQGLDGFTEDQDVAYGYYANVGRQTSTDRDKVQDSEQSLTEHVHVMRVEELQMQTGEEGDVVQFLRLQAERGDIHSQKRLAQMLFWGSNGVKKNIREAVKWFARSALQMTDPTAMYDYSILLLKGTGVKKNQRLGLKLLKKAADMGSVTALNGLGWYYSNVDKNNTKAVHYFELAAQNGSKDAIFNLGVYHLIGANPNSTEKNETAAFECFLQAGELGHVEGAVEAAASLSRGVLPGVTRDPDTAVLLLKQVSEKNGHLGFTIRDALTAYQQGSWDEALMKYAMLAETGLVVAQNNAAHLCEVLNHESACHWRYHNYSTYNHAPHPSGLLKMGDHYSDLGDMIKAISLYSRAVLQGSPQGAYNLAVLTEEGYNIPTDVLELMQIQAQDKNTVVEKLLLRCRELEGEKGDVSPCSLVLIGLQVGKAWQDFTHSTTQLTVALGALTALLLFVLGVFIKSAAELYTAALLNQSSETQRESQPVNHLSTGSELDTTSHHIHSRVLQNGRPLQETADLLITVTGVCVCVLCTMFVSHLV